MKNEKQYFENNIFLMIFIKMHFEKDLDTSAKHRSPNEIEQVILIKGIQKYFSYP